MSATSTRRRFAGFFAAPALRRLLGAAALCGLLPAAAQAQATVVTGLSPARNALAAPRTTAIAVTFDKALDTGPDTRSSLRVFSTQTKRSPGPAVVSGNTLTLPAETFKAGETVMVTVKSSAQDEIRQIFTQPQVYQFTTATAPSAGRFGAGSEITLPDVPASVAAGDVDGDGKVDVVTVSAAGQVSVSLNQGNGTFRPGPTLTVQPNTKKLLLDDVDGDGDLDILVLSNTVSVRLNDGRGNFYDYGTQEVPTPQDPTDIALGDVDGDGDLDLVISSFYNRRNTASIRLNNGQGVFDKDGSFVSTSANTWKATFGDVDNDGDLDLLLTDAQGQVDVQINNGRGIYNEFINNVSYSLTGNIDTYVSSEVFLRDIDADGDLDILATGATNAKVYILLNDGRGAFPTRREIPVAGIRPLAVGDVNGDGYLDLVTLGAIGATGTTANVRLNDGKGNFSAGQELVISPVTPVALALADVNGDGTLDLLAARADQTLSVRLNLPSSVPTPPVAPIVTALSPGRNALAVPRTTNVTATFNQPLRSTPAAQQALRVFSQQAGGRKAGAATVSGNLLTFSPTTPFKAGETVRATISGAVQGSDGAAVTPQVFQFTTATAPSTGTFAGKQQIVPINPFSEDLAVGDINGDGQVDIVAADGYIGTISLRLNNGDGTFPNVENGLGSEELYVSVGQLVSSVVLGDVDNDGDLDIVATNYVEQFSAGATIKGVATVFLNGGKGTFTRTQDVPLGLKPKNALLGDIDGDGDLDLLTSSNNDSGFSNVDVRLNNGQGSFSGTQTVPVNTYGGFTLGDMDGDGDLDLLTNYYDLKLSLNNGQGVFTDTRSIPDVGGLGKIVVQDLDADGDLDILVPSYYRELVQVVLNNGSGAFTVGQEVTVKGVPTDLAAGDIDGDGDVDLLSVSDASVSVRLNNGKAVFSGNQEVATGLTEASRLLLRDVDSDSDLDILALASSNVSVRFNQNPGPPPVAPGARRLNAGGPALTTSFGAFAADQYASPSSRTAATTAAIAGTTDPALYQTERYSTNGTLSYALPVANGRYSVVLHFAEIYWTQPGQRVFNISLEGESKLTNYDIVREVGPRVATTKTFLATVTDSVLNLDLSVPYASGGRDQAKLSALEILPITPVYQLNAGGPALSTRLGSFAADQYYSPSSRTGATTATIFGTQEAVLYRTERYSTNGTLSYALPVANGRYSVVLHFAEIYWTRPGQRVFDINLEGRKVVTNYDILTKVEPFTATTETFAVTVTDGVLNLDLTVPYLSGGRDQAKLSALEVLRVEDNAPLGATAGAAAATLQEEAKLAAALSVYPNPAPGNFTLSLSSPAAQTATLTLTDQLGRVVHTQPLTLQAGANQVPVPAAGLAAGLYQLTLRTADGQRLTSKVSLRP